MKLKVDKDSYYFEDNGKIAAKMVFSMAGKNLMIIDHTDVNPAYRGQGLGKKLLYEIVKEARQDDIKIIPLCPFAKSVFEKEKEIRDVLKENK